MTTSAILLRARSMIDTPAKLGRGDTALDALTWAADGNSRQYREAFRALRSAARLPWWRSFDAWLLRQPHAVVLKMFDRAIAAEQVREERL